MSQLTAFGMVPHLAWQTVVFADRVPRGKRELENGVWRRCTSSLLRSITEHRAEVAGANLDCSTPPGTLWRAVESRLQRAAVTCSLQSQLLLTAELQILPAQTMFVAGGCTVGSAELSSLKLDITAANTEVGETARPCDSITSTTAVITAHRCMDSAWVEFLCLLYRSLKKEPVMVSIVFVTGRRAI